MTQLQVPASPWPVGGSRGPAGSGRTEAAEFRRIMSYWPTGVTVVTTLAGQAPVGCTANAMMSVSLAPPLLVVALAQASTTLDAIRHTGAFGLNVLGAHQRELCQRFAQGRYDERFRDLPYRSQLRLPLLYGAVAAIICTVRDTRSCGDHVLVVGTPVWHCVGEPGSPLVFHRNGFHRLPDADREPVC